MRHYVVEVADGSPSRRFVRVPMAAVGSHADRRGIDEPFRLPAVFADHVPGLLAWDLTLTREPTTRLLHLTHTGYDAGKPICGVDKREAIADGCEFLHAQYVDHASKYRVPLCPDCRRIMAEIDAMPDEPS